MPLSVAVFVSPVEPRLRPGGTVPLVLNVQVFPFVTVSTCEYPTPAVAAGNEEGLKLRFALATLTEYACETEPFAQLALTVKPNVPEDDGVPFSVAVFVTPLEPRLRPGGTVPLVLNLQVFPFVTVSTCEYPTPAVPAGNEEGLKLRLAPATLTE